MKNNDLNRFSLVFGALFVTVGIYYVFSELFTIVNCSSPQTAYFAHTISELGIPINENNAFSPAYQIMNTALLICGASFFWSNLLFFSVIYKNGFSSRKQLFFANALSFLASLGTAIVGICHADASSDAILYLHYAGASCSFIFGNSLIIFTCGKFKANGFESLASFGKILGFIGLFSGFMTIVCELTPLKNLSGLAERFTVYPIVVWEILIGLFVLSSEIKKRRLQSVNA